MKRSKFILAASSLLLSVLTPVVLGGAVFAADNQPLPIECGYWTGGEFPTLVDTTEGCDLAVDKQVSVNGGTFVDADTSAVAANANVGDTITYKITVTNTSSQGLTPHGLLVVHDELPLSGVSFTNYTASIGTYTSNDWTFELAGYGESDWETNLPATLTINAKATAQGQYKNTATLSDYDPCVDGCLGLQGYYSDANNTNNTNDAWIDPRSKPQVLADTTTLVSTGSTVAQSVVAGGILTAVLALGFVTRKKSISYRAR